MKIFFHILSYLISIHYNKFLQKQTLTQINFFKIKDFSNLKKNYFICLFFFKIFNKIRIQQNKGVQFVGCDHVFAFFSVRIFQTQQFCVANAIIILFIKDFLRSSHAQSMSEVDYEEDFDSEENMDKFLEDPGFGDGCETNAPKSIQVMDLNLCKLRIYFKSSQDPISELIKNYREVTTCKIKPTTPIYFLNPKDNKAVNQKQEIKMFYTDELSTTVTFYVSMTPQDQIQIKSSIENSNKSKIDYFEIQKQHFYSYNSKLNQSNVQVDVESDDSSNEGLQQSNLVKYAKNQKIQQLQFFNIGKQSNIISKIKMAHNIQEKNKEIKQDCLQFSKISHPKSQPIPSIKKSVILKHGIKEQKKILYNKYQNFHIKTLVTFLIPDSRPSYCVKVGSQILRPHQRLDQLSKCQEFKNKKIECQVIKSYDKIVFINGMKEKQLNIKSISLDLEKIKKLDLNREKVKNRVKDFTFRRGRYTRIEDICSPIQLYSSSYVFKDFNSSLRDLRPSEQENLSSQKYYNFCSSLTNSLIEFDNYIGIVYRGMKNYKFSKFQKVNDCFFWQSFISTTKSSEKAEKFSNMRGSFFHITSLTGKDISDFSLYPSEKQVLLLPFTYFIVDKIKEGQKDEVWLSQLPSPESFTKNIILWVDDKPIRHTNYIRQIEKENPNVEILQLTSTRMLKYWLRQFYWVLNWKGIQLRVISNMTRIEGEIINHYAGVDVIKEFENILNVPILIFCNDKEQAAKNIQEKRVKNKNYQIVTTKSKLKNFCQFENIPK